MVKRNLYTNLFILILLLFFISCTNNTVHKKSNAILTSKQLKDSISAQYKKTAFSSYLNESDSILKKEYKKIKDLYNKNEYTQALIDALNLYDKARKNSQTKYTYLYALLIADIYSKVNNYEKSLHYYKVSLSIILSKNMLEVTDIDDNFISIEYAKALLKIGSAFQKSKNNDSAKYYYNKLDKLKSLNKNVLRYKAISYSNFSGIYQNDTLYDKAKSFSLRSIKILEKLPDSADLASVMNNLANIYLLENNYEKSKKIYLDAIKVIEKDSSTIAKKIKADLYYNLAWVLRNLKDYEAYDNLEKTYDLEEELRDIEAKKMIETITAQYDVKAVKQEEQLKLVRQQRTTWLIGIAGGFTLVILIAAIAYFRIRQKNLRLKLSKNELIQQQKIEKLESESQIRVLNATLKAKESERKRISEELHDGIVGKLFGTRIGLGFLEFNEDNTAKQKHQLFLEELAYIEKEIRDVSHKLSNNLESDDVSFTGIIKQLLKEKSAIGHFKFQLTMDKDVSWDTINELIRINLYRVIQECLQNIVKHAQAKQVDIGFSAKEEQLALHIEDDGIGFSMVKNKKGIGIKNITSRIKKLDGTLTIRSGEGKGTSVHILVPVEAVN